LEVVTKPGITRVGAGAQLGASCIMDDSRCRGHAWKFAELILITHAFREMMVCWKSAIAGMET
jgi:hypothetical protein